MSGGAGWGGVNRGVVKARPVLEYSGLRKEFALYNWPFDWRVMAKEAGLWWVPELKCWKTDKAQRAVRFIKWADEEARARLLDEFGQMRERPGKH